MLQDDADDGDITLESELCFSIYKSANKVSRLYRKYLQPFGLTLPLYLVLVVLWEHEPCHVGRIVQALDLETSTVTPLLKRLQALGYIVRERDVSDERRVTVTLTDRGRALRGSAAALRADLIDRGGTSHDEMAKLRDSLHRLSDVMDDLMTLNRATPRET